MKVFLVGGTGRTGRWILETALARGHEVTALVRGEKNRTGVSHPRLCIVSGDLLEIDDLGAVMFGHDAVLSALNSATVASGSEKLIAAAGRGGVPRFLGVAGGGILQLDETRLRRERPGYPQVFLKSSEGHLRAWKALEASPLSWTLVCAPDILDAPKTGQAKILKDFMPPGGNSVPAGDIASFLLEELETPGFPKSRVGITTKD